MPAHFNPEFDPADVNSDYGTTGGDITVPTFSADYSPFKFWCQKTLPLVFDDSLSYYEVLCKLVTYVNNLLTDLQTATGSIGTFAQQFVVNQTFLNQMAEQLGTNTAQLESYINDRMEDFSEAYASLQEYVNTYFANLDVQEEINTKLDEMAQDGTLDTLLQPFTEDWLENMTAEIAADLAQQNQTLATQNSRISVLEGRMDTFSTLPAGSTSANAELVDIRTNFLGETYGSAGDAVRASDLLASGYIALPFTNLTGGTVDSATYAIDVSKYKGGRIAFIGNFFINAPFFEYPAGTDSSIFRGNNSEAYSGSTQLLANSFEDFTYKIETEYAAADPSLPIQQQVRMMCSFTIPDDFSYQYLLVDGSQDGITGAILPYFIIYGTYWIETPIDPTLTQAGEAAEAKATGDAISAVNERLNLDEAAAFTTEAELLTRDSYKTGAYQINASGNFVFRNDGAFATNFTLDKYEAKPNTRYCGKATIYSGCCAVAFVDENDTALAALGYDDQQGYSFKYVFFDGTSPEGTKYIYALRTTAGYTIVNEYDKTLYKSTVMSLLRNSEAETPREDVTGAIAYSGGTLALRTNGSWAGWTTAKYTVCQGEVITVRGAYSNVNPIGAFVDASGNMTPIWRDEQNTGYTVFCKEVTVTVPDTICEVWINSYGTWTLPNRTIFKHRLAYKGCFEGKKWYMIGDSITEYNTTASIKYYDYIQMRTGILPISLAKGGRGYINGSSSDDKQFYKQALEIGNDADVITILGGGNDVSSYTLGNVTDTGTDTICGCINTAIDNVYATLPLAKLGIITPNPWGSFPPSNPDNKMALLAAAIVQICQNRGIPCLDLYHCSGMRPWETSYKALVYDLSNNDGVHPNNIGHYIMASHIEEFVKKILLS